MVFADGNAGNMVSSDATIDAVIQCSLTEKKYKVSWSETRYANRSYISSKKTETLLGTRLGKKTDSDTGLSKWAHSPTSICEGLSRYRLAMFVDSFNLSF
jgi:hypothetical protein